MNVLETWGEVLATSFSNLWMAFVDFLPKFLGAVIILIIGWIIAAILGNIAAKIIDFLKIDEALTKLNLKKGLEKAGIEFTIAGLIGWLVKWFLIIVFLIAAADILEWVEVTDFLKNVVLYIPNVIIAVIILLAGILVADFVNKVIKESVKAAKLKSASFLGGLAKWAILVFSFMAALVQLSIANALIQTLFTGFVAMLAIGGGLAFGLGGKDLATKALERMRKDISEK
ncbi:MAG TPA: hypothetical protein VGA49_01150 [Patescibacteria group bacterium]